MKLGATKRAPRRRSAAAPTVAATPALVSEILAVLKPSAARPGSQAQQAAASATTNPVEGTGLKPVLALGIDEGLFLIVAASASFEVVKAFARYEPEPLPRFIAEPGYLNAQTTQAGPVVYTAFLPWPEVPAGALQLGCITASDRKPLLAVDCLAFSSLSPEAATALLTRFGRVLLPAVQAVLPESHVLRQALQPELRPVVPQATVKCYFDGVVDGLAHGWIYDSAQAGKVFTVEAVHEGEVVGRGLADLYREDLARNGVGDGCHHFKLTLSYALFDGQTHALSVRAPELGQADLCPPLACSFEASQPVHLDSIPLAQTLTYAQQLGRSLQVRNAQAEQALLQGFRRCVLQQETWLLEEARAGYRRLAEILGPNALCHCKIAETWLLDQQLAQALECYQAAALAEPQFAWAQLGLGNVLRLQGQPLQAQAAYRAAVACSPDLAQAQRRLDSVHGDALVASAAQRVQAGDKAGAVALLRAAVFEQPDHEGICNGLDDLLREPVDRRGAVSHSELAVQADRSRRLLDAMLDEAEHRLIARQVPEPVR